MRLNNKISRWEWRKSVRVEVSGSRTEKKFERQNFERLDMNPEANNGIENRFVHPTYKKESDRWLLNKFYDRR